MHLEVNDYIYQISKGKEEIAFYSIPEFDEWKEITANAKSWKVKYYKGLGTSTPKEAKEYFADMERHRILFDYSGIADDEAISMVSFFIHHQRNALETQAKALQMLQHFVFIYFDQERQCQCSYQFLKLVWDKTNSLIH